MWRRVGALLHGGVRTPSDAPAPATRREWESLRRVLMTQMGLTSSVVKIPGEGHTVWRVSCSNGQMGAHGKLGWLLWRNLRV